MGFKKDQHKVMNEYDFKEKLCIVYKKGLGCISNNFSCQYFVDFRLLELHIFKDVSTSFAHLEIDILGHSSVLNSSNTNVLEVNIHLQVFFIELDFDWGTGAFQHVLI